MTTPTNVTPTNSSNVKQFLWSEILSGEKTYSELLTYMSDIDLAREQSQNFFALQFIIEMTESLLKEKKSHNITSKKAQEIIAAMRLRIETVKREIARRDAIARASGKPKIHVDISFGDSSLL